MRVALVTGCSSGIGKVTARALAEMGFTTYATARNPESITGLQELGCRVLRLDVTDNRSMEEAVSQVEREVGQIDLLVNNAGYGEYGPVEELSLEAVRRCFETNVFGLVRMCQLVLPGMRRKGTGRIINVSSMAGEMVLPLGGAYHASKYAVEAFSDALRAEVRRFGVRVIVVQPGPISTKFSTSMENSGAMQPSGGIYDPAKKSAVDSFAEYYRHPKGGASAEAVAVAILESALSPNPRSRVKVSLLAQILPRLRKLLPGRVWDAGIERSFGRAFVGKK